MNLKKNAPSGSSIENDSVNKVVLGQWNFISTLEVPKKVGVERQIGSDHVDFQIEEALKCHTQDNYLGGVDIVDRDKKIGGSFTKEAHFQKWYQMC